MTFADLIDNTMCAVKWSFMDAEIIFTDGTNPGVAEEMVVKGIHRHWTEEGKLIIEFELENVSHFPEPIEHGEPVTPDSTERV